MTYRHCKKPLALELKEVKRIDGGLGYPSKLCRLDHSIQKVIPKSRKIEGSFTSKSIQVVIRLEHFPNRTVSCTISKADHKYLCSRKKGM